jgi:hypothetical protein
MQTAAGIIPAFSAPADCWRMQAEGFTMLKHLPP